MLTRVVAHKTPLGRQAVQRRLFRSLCLAAALPDLALGILCAKPLVTCALCPAAAAVPGQTPLPNVAAILPSQTPNPSLPNTNNNAALGERQSPPLTVQVAH